MFDTKTLGDVSQTGISLCSFVKVLFASSRAHALSA